MTTDYPSRMSISVRGNSDTWFTDKYGNVLAHGYERVVIGQRGPYVEFTFDQVRLAASWKLVNDILHEYYIEYRSIEENIKLYSQLKTVDYADYRVGKLYVSPFDLYVGGKVIIEPLRKKKP